MAEHPLDAEGVARTLRSACLRCGIPISALAVEAGVSARLIGELERGRRPNVSLRTELHLLSLVGVSVRLYAPAAPEDPDHARAERAAERRRTWTGSHSTLSEQVDPTPPSSAEDRLSAVARVSALAISLQRAKRTTDE